MNIDKYNKLNWMLVYRTKKGKMGCQYACTVMNKNKSYSPLLDRKNNPLKKITLTNILFVDYIILKNMFT